MVIAQITYKWVFSYMKIVFFEVNIIFIFCAKIVNFVRNVAVGLQTTKCVVGTNYFTYEAMPFHITLTFSFWSKAFWTIFKNLPRSKITRKTFDTYEKIAVLVWTEKFFALAKMFSRLSRHFIIDKIRHIIFLQIFANMTLRQRDHFWSIDIWTRNFKMDPIRHFLRISLITNRTLTGCWRCFCLFLVFHHT